MPSVGLKPFATKAFPSLPAGGVFPGRAEKPERPWGLGAD